jgi:hypothetical protein
MLGLQAALAAHGAACHAWSQALKAQINACADVAELDALMAAAIPGSLTEHGE